MATAPRPLWRAVASEAPEALPEHGPEWLDAMVATGQYSDASRLYEFRDGRRFVLPLVRRRGLPWPGGWFGSFPPAWGIGGLVGKDIDAPVVGRYCMTFVRFVPPGSSFGRIRSTHLCGPRRLRDRASSRCRAGHTSST